VTKYETGAAFGELALNDDGYRKASIFCINDCYLATLDKQDYKRVLKRLLTKQTALKVLFFSQLPFLNH
jgi:hypothetical protein